LGHLRLTTRGDNGTELEPEPPVPPVGMGKQTRGVEPASLHDLDESQVADWMRQAAAKPFVGGKKRTKT
jgi:hypothetical protein